jgi:hypothetical protein
MKGGKTQKFCCFCGIFVVLVALIGLIVGVVIILRPKSLALLDDDSGYLR